MTVEFIGLINTREYSEIRLPTGEPIDPDYVRLIAQAHEKAGFDRIFMSQGSTGPDAFLVALHAALVTSKVNILVAHRPGFMAPTLAARKMATFDCLTAGRLAVGIVTGPTNFEMQKDCDFLTKDDRYSRTAEYLEIVRRVWTSDTPFDHHGSYYRCQNAYSEVKPLQKPHIPIYFSGASDAAISVAGKHANVYASWGEPIDRMREVIARLRGEAARHVRQIRFSISFRPILADTEEKAWRRARQIRERAIALREASGLPTSGHSPENVGSQRQLASAARGERLDKTLWTGIASVTGGGGSSTALVGTAAQIADTLLDYYDLGVTTFLIRGFDPLDDTVEYGQELIPLTRKLVAARIGERK
jgi:alkanesulfonate monooxygenase